MDLEKEAFPGELKQLRHKEEIFDQIINLILLSEISDLLDRSVDYEDFSIDNFEQQLDEVEKQPK